MAFLRVPLKGAATFSVSLASPRGVHRVPAKRRGPVLKAQVVHFAESLPARTNCPLCRLSFEHKIEGKMQEP